MAKRYGANGAPYVEKVKPAQVTPVQTVKPAVVEPVKVAGDKNQDGKENSN